jgi:protein bicaudal C
MKMDVSYTDHSHIIGKGGNTIRRVMAETNCHIHFPDSNRSNPNEKSNQVSIAGEMSGVERARYLLSENWSILLLDRGLQCNVMGIIVADPDPPDPYVLGLPDPDALVREARIWIRRDSGSGSFPFLIKVLRRGL